MPSYFVFLFLRNFIFLLKHFMFKTLKSRLNSDLLFLMLYYYEKNRFDCFILKINHIYTEFFAFSTFKLKKKEKRIIIITRRRNYLFK